MQGIISNIFAEQIIVDVFDVTSIIQSRRTSGEQPIYSPSEEQAVDGIRMIILGFDITAEIKELRAARAQNAQAQPDSIKQRFLDDMKHHEETQHKLCQLHGHKKRVFQRR